VIVLQLFLEFGLLSFVAFGGATALLPEMHRVVVENHQWLDDTTFTHLYAIAQAAPGPNVLVVTLIGWKVAGVAGAIAATLAMCLPMSVLIYLLIDRWQGFAGCRWQKAVSLGVAPLAIGLIFSGATLIAQAAAFGLFGWAVVAATLFANLRTRLHPLWFIAVGGLLGGLTVLF
jgi:chromate transporter